MEQYYLIFIAPFDLAHTKIEMYSQLCVKFLCGRHGRFSDIVQHSEIENSLSQLLI